ncbi:MAG: phenylacetate-CoA oxygenase subunit PaaJ [Cyclobacteriaceae bacterium]|jgi:ring-1,2-phenylacetyl-CoA epoxidase subunit PaaD|nr:phenylacetate-CoA oxygenase subunit PaaJ [Cyclobacteriaceae bacterium]
MVTDISGIDKKTVLEWLEAVKDPEIPVLSLVDMGVITHVEVSGKRVAVEMTPTFVGCPAMDIMKQEVAQLLTQKGLEPTVNVSFREPWSSDKISEKGKAALKKFGLAPPPSHAALIHDIDFLEHVPCPRCHGTDTELRNPFGPTLCRSIHYCRTCQEAFEQFKPVG